MNRVTVRVPDSSSLTVDEMVEDIQAHTDHIPVQGTLNETEGTCSVEIDDNADVREIAREMRGRGYEVTR